MADIFERLLKHYGPIGQHRARAHGYFAFPKLEGDISSRMQFRGKEMIVWSLNNYLGLANHPEVRKADAEGAAKYGLALPMGARMMSGAVAGPAAGAATVGAGASKEYGGGAAGTAGAGAADRGVRQAARDLPGAVRQCGEFQGRGASARQ